ncbi:DUF3592 domain-containing protein [Arundinibacter roseus]|uniref:DUF3592 domain-containing protein n=1 Tax=Arundinibacter roseus TaxID=2070510 RepID=A0A4R4KKQ1_9BACT|nr:DUF3592 domain-containing protein [Arundinibacter roseus]TDB68840.1 hypothetical protein EZE20_00390 [Arundinibacter roseus]
MENFVAEYGNALVALVSGAICMALGWHKYSLHSQWLSESKKAKARVIKLEKVEIETDGASYEMERPTFRYHTTGEILVAKVNQLFEKGQLKVGQDHTVRYNHRTPGRILSEMAEDYALLIAFGGLFLGGVLILISLILFLN